MSVVNIESVIEKYSHAKRDALIPLLQEVQAIDGYLSSDAVMKVSEHLGLAPAKVYGVATFYNQFRFSPPGKCHIQICRGTACHVKGSAAVLETAERLLNIKAGQTTRDGHFSIEVVACIGACGLSPLICCNDEFHAEVSPAKTEQIIKKYQRKVKTHGSI